MAKNSEQRSGHKGSAKGEKSDEEQKATGWCGLVRFAFVSSDPQVAFVVVVVGGPRYPVFACVGVGVGVGGGLLARFAQLVMGS